MPRISKTELRRLVLKELPLKLRLEGAISKELSRVFDLLVNDFYTKYSKTGLSLNVNAYSPKINSIISKHLDNVYEVFKHQVRSKVKGINQYSIFDSNYFTDTKDIDDIARNVYKRWAEDKARFYTQRINSTTASNIEKSIAQARVSLLDSLETFDLDLMAEQASGFLKRKLDGRISTIANTITQTGAETSKHIDAQAFQGWDPSTGTDASTTEGTLKNWFTMGDSIVREKHIPADGQIRKFNEPFDVGGEQLMFPADASLGASLGNICNCRCGVGYIFPD